MSEHPKSMVMSNLRPSPRPRALGYSSSSHEFDRRIEYIAGVRGEGSGVDSVLDAADALRDRGGVCGMPSMMESEANGDDNEPA